MLQYPLEVINDMVGSYSNRGVWHACVHVVIIGEESVCYHIPLGVTTNDL